MRWLPIQTAPKDGTRILLGWRTVPDSVRIGAWDNDQWTWLGSRPLNKDPSHWMPLPPTP